MAKVAKLLKIKTFLRSARKGRIVLAGGCFDILHIGHVRFLAEAKKMGDYLVVLLENDERVKNLKGKNRPIFTQEIRAEILSALIYVDLVVLLPMMEKDDDYLKLVKQIKPDIIAVRENDPNIERKKLQAQTIGGELRVVPLVKSLSSSALAKIMEID